MYLKTCSAWADAAMETWALGVEASTVIGLRIAKVAAGGTAANDEIMLMISEKMKSAAKLQTDAAFGQLGGTPLASVQKVIRHYRTKVTANSRRLSKPA
ncbi:hypothetical protein WG907_07670 [Sphingobium sp. AN558]|uniref:hypothetical protein n=1 Tax=Sphingobium sp. AN558 TaxID=3133442 RepID=UPI0030BDFF0A